METLVNLLGEHPCIVNIRFQGSPDRNRRDRRLLVSPPKNTGKAG